MLRSARAHLPVGLHGAALLFVIAPVGLTLARTLDLQFPTPAFAATVFPIGLVAYYLAWKYLVGFFNELLEIA